MKPTTVVGLLFAAAISLADTVKYDLYSWPHPTVSSDWCFALIPSSNDPVDGPTVKTSTNNVCGRHDIKRLMLQLMPEGSKIYWKANKDQGLVMPTQDVVNDLGRFVTTSEFTLVLPKDQPQSKRGDPWK